MNLAPGEHIVTVFVREDGTRLDRLRLVPPLDSDGDGVPDDQDAFPNDPTETVDSDNDGIGDNSDPLPNDPSNGHILEVEGEAATLFGSFAVSSNGQYIEAPEGSGTYYGFNAARPHRAEFRFVISQAGVYQIEGDIRGTNGTSDSFWVSVDGSPDPAYLWDTGTQSSITAVRVTNRGTSGPVAVNLTEGEHIVTVFVREDGTRLDTLRLVPQ